MGGPELNGQQETFKPIGSATFSLKLITRIADCNWVQCGAKSRILDPKRVNPHYLHPC